MSDFDLPFGKRPWWRAPSPEDVAKKVAVQQLVSRHAEEYVALLNFQRRLLSGRS